MCLAPQRRALFRHVNFQKYSGRGVLCTFGLGNVLGATTACIFLTCQLPEYSGRGVLCTFGLGNVLGATTACTFSTCQLPKVFWMWCAFSIWAWKCASRHNGVHFFDVSTSKRILDVVCCVHLDLEMCLVPQRRALFRHVNFQTYSGRGVLCTFGLGNVLGTTTACIFLTCQLPEYSGRGVLCTFGLGNVLGATTACTFSTCQLPNVFWTWCAVYIWTWKCASRHNGVHFFDMSTSRVFWTWCAVYIWTWKCASRHNGVHFFDVSTSKRILDVVCCVHLDLEMCFAPQRRSRFRCVNFQKYSGRGVKLCIWTWTCAWRRNGVHFFDVSTSNVFWTWCAVYIWTWKCAWCHNGVHFFDVSTSKRILDVVCFVHLDLEMCFAPQRRVFFSTCQLPKVCVLCIWTWKRFFISQLDRRLRTRRCREPTFRPSGATNHLKNMVICDFSTFSRACIFFLLAPSLL